MIEEKVIQPDSVTPAEQPVADTPSQPQAPNLDSVKAEYEAQVAAARKEAAEAQEKFKGIKTKLDDVYKQKDEQRKQELEDQGQWKTLWEEANKTAQEKEQKIMTLSQQLEEMKTSNEVASTKTTALAAILDPFPTLIGPIICAPDPITTSLPIVGCLFSFLWLSLSMLGAIPPRVTA